MSGPSATMAALTPLGTANAVLRVSRQARNFVVVTVKQCTIPGMALGLELLA